MKSKTNQNQLINNWTFSAHKLGCHLSPFNLKGRKQYKQIGTKQGRCLRIATTMVPSFSP